MSQVRESDGTRLAYLSQDLTDLVIPVARSRGADRKTHSDAVVETGVCSQLALSEV
jgi:hypothetical protein